MSMFRILFRMIRTVEDYNADHPNLLDAQPNVAVDLDKRYKRFVDSRGSGGLKDEDVQKIQQNAVKS